jgi:uncharacterized protein (TIGR02265 family)
MSLVPVMKTRTIRTVSSVEFSEFAVPDWDAVLDPEEYARAVPAHATVKGMFMQKILDEAGHRGVALPDHGPYRAFKDYPLQKLLDLEVDVAPRLFPDVSLREGLRRLGWTAYPTLLDSVIGRIIFGVLGRDLPAIFRTTAKGYKVSLNIGSADVIEVGDNHAVIRLREMYNFADAYQVGVFEGVFRYYDRPGEVRLRRVTAFDIDILAVW